LVVLRGPDDLFPTVKVLIQTLIHSLASEIPAARL
jgi:hypothetical protein